MIKFKSKLAFATGGLRIYVPKAMKDTYDLKVGQKVMVEIEVLNKK